MSQSFDVLGLGITAVDDLLYVESYPPPDTKVPVLDSARQCGGLTATALVAAARLGSSCAYAGVMGYDELSRFVLERMEEEGINIDYTQRWDNAGPAHSRIIVDQTRQTRNIFFEFMGFSGADPNWPEPEVIRAARVLFVDHYGIEGMARAARIARQAGIPVVADLERTDPSPFYPELLALVDHLIVSRDFARTLTGEAGPGAAARALWAPGRQVVAVTCGTEGSWYISDDSGPPRHQPAFPVETVDTTGCGDVFHGAYASTLARGVSLPERMAFASAAAAIKATRPGGQSGIPTRPVVEAFLLSH